MKKNIFSVTVVAIAFAFFFVACGGEEPEHPDDENNDEIAVTDDEPDNEQPDDVVDEEPVDDDQLPLEEVCKNFLDMEGNWSIVEPTTVSGEITLMLSVAGENCKIAVTGKWEFAWEGTEIQQLGCPKEANMYSFFSLQEMEGEKLVIKKSSTEEVCENGQGATVKFQRI